MHSFYEMCSNVPPSLYPPLPPPNYSFMQAEDSVVSGSVASSHQLDGETEGEAGAAARGIPDQLAQKEPPVCCQRFFGKTDRIWKGMLEHFKADT